MIVNECIILDQKFKYDGCSSGALEKGIEFYSKVNWVYVGSGCKTCHNGVENNWGYLLHFFVAKYRLKEKPIEIVTRKIKLEKLNENGR